MSILINKTQFADSMYRSFLSHAALAGQETDSMRLIQLLSGVLTETLLLFDDPDEGLEASFASLSFMMDCKPQDGPLGPSALPPAYMIDYETEQGRALARTLFEEWLDCAHEFHDLVIFAVHHLFMRMEEEGQPRQETFRIFIECATRSLAFEIAAQELCDLVIESKIGKDGWSLAESVSGLSAIAGRSLALSQNACQVFDAPSLPDRLDYVAHVMTQEAVRLGIPAGTDWRFGLAANDCPCSAPYDLITALEPSCREFFAAIQLHDLMDQAVACAKAAGRMLAVASGGEMPEIEPVIAKPLAMAAMTETYKTVCKEAAVVSC